jgi:hypothetical protein
MVVEYTKKLMTEGKDYGVIPGTGTKPTLLKPGAEKLCSLFGLFPDFETLKEIEDFDKGLFFYREKCTLYRNGEPIASGVGSCNSKEKKYRYRNVYESKASDEEKAKAVSVETRTGKYGPYKVYKIENPEPFELVNTIDKMAQKRALVAATLIATNASEFFTQDIEDMDFVEGTYSDVEAEQPKPKRNPAPKPDQVEDAIKDAGPVLPENGDSKEVDLKSFNRPYTAEQLKMVLEHNASLKNKSASDKQRNLLGSLLSEHFQDDTKRYECSEWLFGARSTKDIDGAMVIVALDWLKPTKDDGGAYAIDNLAKTELGYAHTAALEASGQEALL